eukprot:TRINITY_DN1183_c0_g1_i5.p1 TRINITY_DN1183_c0_g1~~TRINITY_DN1183_c0_g1_i5.p1  ORF type:complete len:466 (-),score=71.08 TRINITY_DN1183_c0_g1_i5:100-1335(-)
MAGQGTFGTVIDCLDKKYNERVAVKVVRSVPRYIEAGYVEADILEKIRKADAHRQSLCVRMYGSFEFRHRDRRHLCLVFESLGRSLYDFIKKNHYRGFSLEHVRSFAYQLVKAVAFCHSIDLVHTDLKPENILLANSDYKEEFRQGEKHAYRVPVSTEIRLIDFGGATFINDHHAKIINTRQYRAPEVIFGLGWSFPSDMWSVGCILAELFTGELLFPTHDDLEHLALMEKVLETQIPHRMCEKALEPYRKKASSSRSRSGSSRHAKSRGHFSRSPRRRHSHSYSRSCTRPSHSRSRSNSRARSRSRSRSSSVERTPSLSKERSAKRGRSSSTSRADRLLHFSTCRLRWPEGAVSRDSVRHVARMKTLSELIPDPELIDLLRRMLVFDPDLRISAREALAHPFFAPFQSRD